MAFREIVLTGVDDAFEALRLSNKKFFGNYTETTWFFRGHSKVEWELKPSVWRDTFVSQLKDWNNLIPMVGHIAFSGRELPFRLVGSLSEAQQERCKDAAVRLFAERYLISNFYSVASDVGLISNPIQHSMDYAWENPHVFLQAPNPGLLALPQHHGVPTRLLDWTRDALTAFAFALNGASADEDIAIWCLNTDTLKSSARTAIEWEQIAYPAIYEGDNSLNKYLHAQRGAFTYMKEGEKHYIDNGKYPDISDICDQNYLIKFIVKLGAADKIQASKMLMKERKTRAHFMPDFNNCAEYAKQILRLNANFS